MGLADSSNAAAFVRWVASSSLLFNDEASPFSAAVRQGAPKLVVVTGENASGKSLLARVVAVIANRESVLPVSVSIRERAGSGERDGAGMRKVMMFGDEEEQSTGATSVRVVQAAFANLDRPSVLILDEPELGLSRGYTLALGKFIGSQAAAIPAKCRGVVVVTHSRELVDGLWAGYGTLPTHVAVSAYGPAQADLQKWLETPESRSVEELLALRDVGHERWLRVLDLLKVVE